MTDIVEVEGTDIVIIIDDNAPRAVVREVENYAVNILETTTVIPQVESYPAPVVREVEYQIVEVVGAGPPGPPGTPNPPSDAGDELGTTLLRWGGLWLTDGGFIDFGSGDIRIDHSTNLLTISGGVVEFSSRPTFSGSGLLATSDIGVTVQAYDPDLQSWLAVNRAAGFDTFATTPSVANLAALLTDEAAGFTNFLVTPSVANLMTFLTDDASGLGTFMVTPSVANLMSLLTDDAAGLGDFMVTPSSANLRTLVTDETGTGSLVFGTTPTFTTSMLLSSGFVFNWNAGDVTLTHSADTLTLAGGSLVLPAAGLTVGASVPFSDSAGVLTLQNVDAIDATTEATIEAAIDTLANLTSIQGVSFTFGSYAATILNNTSELGFKQAVNLEIGVDVQAYDADLASWAGVTRAAGFDTFVATPTLANFGTLLTDDPAGLITFMTTPSSANLRTLVTDETGSGALVFGTTPTFTTSMLLTSGFVFNWDASDLTLTHSLNALTLVGGSLVLPAAGLTVGASVPFSDSAGVLTLQNVDALDATTEATIETAIDTLANLTSIQGVSFTFGSYAATLLNNTSEATFKAAVNLEIGVDVQAYDADLTTWAGVTPAAGVTTFLTTPSSANLAAAVTDETGTGALVFANTPTLVTPVLGAATGTSLALSSGTGLTIGSSVPFSDVAGVLTLQNVDALDATTEATIEVAIDTLANLTSIQGVTFTFGSYAATLLNNTSEATFKAAVNLEIGVDVQAYDADLLSWAGVTRAAGFDTFVATPSSANLAALLTDETGTGLLVFGTSPSFTTSMLLSSGFVFNWNAGDVTLTHSLNTLTLTGGSLVLDAAGLTVGTSIPFSDSAGVLTLQNVDALDATTEATIEAAIDTLANLTSIQGVSFTFGSYAATLLNNTSEATFKAAVNLEIGVDVQAYDADLGSWAGVTRAAGFDTFVTTPSSANLAGLVTDETGTGALVFANTPTLVTPVLGAATGTSLVLSSGTGLQIGSSVPFSDAAGVLTLQNVDALDATTEATIEAAIDTLANLTSIQGVSFTFGSYAATLLNNTSEATFKAAVNLEIGVDVQAYDADLLSWAGVTRAAGFDTFATTPSSANLASLVTDETGTGALVFANTPTLVTPVLGAATGTSLVLSSGTGLTIGLSVPFSDSAGVLTLQNVDALDATTEATIEVAIDTLANLTSIQGVSFTFGSYAATLLNNTSEATFKAAVNLEIGVDVQAYDADLASWAAVVRAAGFDTFVATPSSANLASLVTDETGTGALVFANTPTLVTPVLGAATGTSLVLSSGTGLQVGSSVPFSDAAGVLTLQNVDALDATTEATIEAAIDTLANLGSIQGVAFTFGSYAATLLNNTSEATFKAAVNLEIGVDVQAYDADLLSWAGVTRAAGFDTFVTTPSSANLAALVTDETGSGLLVFGTAPAISDPDFTGLVDVQQSFAWTGDITPAQITANQNDYSPTGLSTATVIRASTDASRDITGLAGGSDGRLILFNNVGTQDIVLVSEDSGSTAANRFALSASVTLAAGQGAMLLYDSTSSRWRMIGGTGSGGGGGGGGDVSAAANFGVDNRLIRSDGTLKGVQASGITIDDTDNVTGVASITVGSAGLTVGSSVPFSDSAGTLTLQNVDALDATTEATIEAAIDTLANLASIQGVAFTFGAYAATLLNNVDEAAFKAAVNLEIGVDVQAYDTDLASWAGVTRAAGFDTFVATPSSANLRSLLTDETGTGAAVFADSPALTGTPTAPTAAHGTSTTQIATTAFVETNLYAPAGTAMLFAQTAAPLGWTKSTTHDNKALRLVSGTAGSGGSTAFTSVFTSRTIAEANLPSHSHGVGSLATASGGDHQHLSFHDSIGGNLDSGMTSSQYPFRGVSDSTRSQNYRVVGQATAPNCGLTSSAGSHTHSLSGSTGSIGSGTAMDFAVQYVDVIIATKD